MAFWEKFPPEVFVDLALKYFNPTDIITFCSNQEVKFAREICSDQEFWKIFYRRDFSGKISENISPRDLYHEAVNRVQNDLLYWALTAYEKIPLNFGILNPNQRFLVLTKLAIENNVSAFDGVLSLYPTFYSTQYQDARSENEDENDNFAYEILSYYEAAAFHGSLEIIKYLDQSSPERDLNFFLPYNSIIIREAIYGKQEDVLNYFFDRSIRRFLQLFGINSSKHLQDHLKEINFFWPENLARKIFQRYGIIDPGIDADFMNKLIKSVLENDFSALEDIVRKFYSKDFVRNDRYYRALVIAADLGNLEIVKFLNDHQPISYVTAAPYARAWALGHTAVKDFLKKKYNLTEANLLYSIPSN